MKTTNKSINSEVLHRLLTIQAYDLENQQIVCKDEGNNLYKIQINQETINKEKSKLKSNSSEWEGFNIDKRMENNIPVNSQIIFKYSYPVGVEDNMYILEGKNIVKVVPAKEDNNIFNLGVKAYENKLNTYYKIKHETKGRSFEQIDQIGLEMDQLAEDSTKNEKMGVQFRTLLNNEIVDISVYMRGLYDNTLLNSIKLKQFFSDYQEYLKTIPELEGKKYSSEVLVHYYPLDINNKNENISGEDKFIESVYKVDNNNLINEVHTYDFSAQELKTVKKLKP